MNKRILKMYTLLILAVLFSKPLLAQVVEFGEEFNNVGRLKNPGTEWTTNVWPKNLVIMYNNGKTTINGNAMNIIIEPLSGSEPTDEVKLVIGQARNWAALKYAFKLPGKYKVSALDRERKFLASSIITINGPVKPEPKPEPVAEKPVEKPVKKEEPTKEEILENAPEPIFVESVIEEELTEEEKETLLFESFYIAFGRTVQSGMLMGQNEKFKGIPGGVDLQVLFSNNEGFGTETISVDIWFKPDGTKEYSEHFTEMTVPIGKNVTQANFPLNIRDRGSYKVSLYTGDADAVWIGSGYVSIY
ncbi:MAG: hypothetical protein K9J17_08975 [Flavobacteriales bacterium]|nr:hypothetical protein [Flavobacteriales bacterium]